MKMRVYRIENKYQEGPYTSGDQKSWRKRSHAGDEHPEPKEDLVGYFRSGVHHCGFSSMEHLFQWFNKEELLNLHELEFKIQIYMVDSRFVQLGVKQLVFSRGKAYQIGTGRSIKDEVS